MKFKVLPKPGLLTRQMYTTLNAMSGFGRSPQKCWRKRPAKTLEKVKGFFCNETGYQTPKIDTRAVVFKDGKILLTRENNGTWALPGGWCDVLQSVGSNTVKELKEETGLDGRPVRLIAVEDRNKHNTPVYAYGVCKVFILCEVTGRRFREKQRDHRDRLFCAG